MPEQHVHTKEQAIGHLVHGLEQTAWWRGNVAERYPDDERNAKSRNTLKRLARRVPELPADAPCLSPLNESVELANACGLTGDYWHSGPPEAFGRLGFDGDAPHSDEELDELISFAAEQVRDSVRHWCEPTEQDLLHAHGSRGLGKSWLPTSSEASEDDRLQRYMIAAELELDAADAHWRSGFTEEEIEARLVRDAEQYMEDVDEGHRDAVTETLEELEEKRG